MKAMKFLVQALLTSAILCSSGCSTLQPVSISTPLAIDQATLLFETAMAGNDVPGLSVSVADRGGVLWSAAFGWADIDRKIPMTTDTRLRVASISKILTTAGLAKLIEDDQIDLDAPIQTYVPEFPIKKWPITVRQLSAHIAGVRHYKGDEFFMHKHFATVSEGLQIFENDPLEFQPGTAYSYSSYGWNLISAAIEGVREEDFLLFMQAEVFGPLRLNSIEPEDVRYPITNMATPYQLVDGQITRAPFVDNSYKWAGGGFIATSDDLAQFAIAHASPGYLKSETLELLFANQILADGTEVANGIGWQSGWHNYEQQYCGDEAEHQSYSLCATIERTPNAVMHAGGAVGGEAMLILDRDRGLAVVVMKNDYGSSANTFRLALETLGLFQ
jgi:serine beta-lactamase-like protein LACTB